MTAKAMVVTDLDGTLFQKNSSISRRNYQTLVDLGKGGILRVIATGRNLFSAYKVLSPEFPIDYLVFSSGAGILAWQGQELLFSAAMAEDEVHLAYHCLAERSLDFMVHRPVPDNHHFTFFSSGQPNPDFEDRCRLYGEFATPGREKPPGKACQLVAIEPWFHSRSFFPDIQQELDYLTVVRTTSPLDHRSRWIEIFSRRVSKARASIRIAADLGIPEKAVMAIGNDYNDLDLLNWAARSYVVHNAPPELSTRFPVVRSADESDFSEAVALWRSQMEL
jgi:hydroxymethylpyrimidine pyrophosphatase-like HAD family hydrolase